MHIPTDLILAIDQGTTGSTALLLDTDAHVIASHNVEFPNYFPEPGLVEHDAEEIWASVAEAVKGVIDKVGVTPNVIRAIGITNQRETSLFWHRVWGDPIHRALVWQDRRTANQCQALKDAGHEEKVRATTGLVLDPYFSATKARWMLDNVPFARKAAELGEICFGTIDSYLVFRLTGEHVTDTSNASRTLLYDIHGMGWSEEMLDLFQVPPACLPEVRDSAEIYGATRNVGFLPDGIPVAGIAGDQQAALFGQACFQPGMAKCTYGTGAFVLLNTGPKPVESRNRMLTTVAWRLKGQTTYALEGSAFIAGAAVQWLRDQMGFFTSAAEVEILAAQVPDAGGVVFVPAFVGLGAPHWRPDARGLLMGLSRGTTRAHVARAVLDGVALQIGDILGAMASDLGAPLRELRVDGGACRNNLLMQFQSDILGVPCVRPMVAETTALGAAFLAGLGAGIWTDKDTISQVWAQDRRFEPSMEASRVEAHVQAWKRAVERA